MEPYSFSILWE